MQEEHLLFKWPCIFLVIICNKIRDLLKVKFMGTFGEEKDSGNSGWLAFEMNLLIS